MVDRFVPRIQIPFTVASPRRVGARSDGLAREAPSAVYGAGDPGSRYDRRVSAMASGGIDRMERVVSTTVDFERSPQEVFDFIADTDNWLKIGVLDVAPRGRLALGTEGWHVRKQFGGNARATWRVSEFEAGRKLTMLARGGGMEIRDETLLEAIPSGTRATFTETFTPRAFAIRLLLPLFMGSIRKELRAYYASIKAQVESDSIAAAR
jgi:hypothetical protein